MNDIKQQLNAKIGDTSERVSRVQQQVNLRKLQQPRIKKVQWGYYATIAALIGVLAFCINLLPSALNDIEVQLSGPEPSEILLPPGLDEDTTVVEKGDYYELLKQYFFPDNSEAVFLGGFENGGVKTQTFWLGDHYVQQVISNDGGDVERVFRLNGNQIELVYDGVIDESGRTQLSVEELNELPVMEIVLKAPFEIGDQYGEWTVIETAGTVTTTYGDFSDVLIVENADEEYGSRMRRYYVRGFGEVKGEFSVLNQETGDYEVFSSTDLASIDSSVVEEKSVSLFERKVETNYEAQFHSGWKKSPDGLKQSTIDGKGETADEEGEAALVVDYPNTNEFVIYTLKDNIHRQNTPKYVEWIDDNRLFVIVGLSYGTVTRGGQLYEMNIKENTTIPVFEDLKQNEEIMSIKANGDGSFTYQKHVYDDEIFAVGHIEEGTISVPDK
ncbi:DUF4652 domain-containing protein [Sporosarcina sp. NPDC096371]|uniref:DUF4652 domain-containing protein n=1 Tax=Sporosarcina sp. NPDC096371 TaxID=3364530 RepID=UPI00382FF3F7